MHPKQAFGRGNSHRFALRLLMCRGVSALLLAAGSLTSQCVLAHADDLSFPTPIDPPLAVTPGDQLAAGYHLSLAFDEPSVAIILLSPRVGYVASCPDRTDAAVFMSLPDAELATPPFSMDWVPGDPAGNEHDPAVYQGQVPAPDVCEGQAYVIHASLFEVAEIDAPNLTNATIRVQFHLVDATSDPSLGGAWSPVITTVPVTPTPAPTSSPTPTNTPPATSAPFAFPTFAVPTTSPDTSSSLSLAMPTSTPPLF